MHWITIWLMSLPGLAMWNTLIFLMNIFCIFSYTITNINAFRNMQTCCPILLGFSQLSNCWNFYDPNFAPSLFYIDDNNDGRAIIHTKTALTLHCSKVWQLNDTRSKKFHHAVGTATTRHGLDRADGMSKLFRSAKILKEEFMFRSRPYIVGNTSPALTNFPLASQPAPLTPHCRSAATAAMCVWECSWIPQYICY